MVTAMPLAAATDGGFGGRSPPTRCKGRPKGGPMRLVYIYIYTYIIYIYETQGRPRTQQPSGCSPGTFRNCPRDLRSSALLLELLGDGRSNALKHQAGWLNQSLGNTRLTISHTGVQDDVSLEQALPGKLIGSTYIYVCIWIYV